jgi:hypothetical protein
VKTARSILVRRVPVGLFPLCLHSYQFALRYHYRRPVKSSPSQAREYGMRSESGRIHDAFDAPKISEFDFSSGVWGFPSMCTNIRTSIDVSNSFWSRSRTYCRGQFNFRVSTRPIFQTDGNADSSLSTGDENVYRGLTHTKVSTERLKFSKARSRNLNSF